MTRKILGGLAAALLLGPALASAKPNLRIKPDLPPPVRWNVRNGGNLNVPLTAQYSTIGSGILWGQSLGTVQSPSNTQVDPSTRGPLNDVQPGAQGSGTSDPPQAANPKPIY